VKKISNRSSVTTSIAYNYMEAKREVIERGFYSEIDWQEELVFEDITESDFIREAAWVILSSGMRETVIRGKFREISNAFYNWDSAKTIYFNQSYCMKKSLRAFNSSRKIEAIIQLASMVYCEGFDKVKRRLLEAEISYIKEFPFMGPATSYHLAKNLGLPVAKPDRHLCRLAEATGFQSPIELCSEIARMIGEKISVVDIVLWRFATIHKNYLDFFINEGYNLEV